MSISVWMYRWQAVCVLGEKGGIVAEAPVSSTPDALVSFMRKLPFEIVGLEAGPMSQWLHKGLTDAGFEAVLMETRQVKAALKAMPIKTAGCRGHCTATADGMVPPGALQIGVVAGGPGASGLAEVAEDGAHQHRTVSARAVAQFRPEARSPRAAGRVVSGS